MIQNTLTNLFFTMTKKPKMNTVKFYLLFLFMIALTNTSFAGQGDDKGDAEPECDYITEVDTL